MQKQRHERSAHQSSREEYRMSLQSLLKISIHKKNPEVRTRWVCPCQRMASIHPSLNDQAAAAQKRVVVRHPIPNREAGRARAIKRRRCVGRKSTISIPIPIPIPSLAPAMLESNFPFPLSPSPSGRSSMIRLLRGVQVPSFKRSVIRSVDAHELSVCLSKLLVGEDLYTCPATSQYQISPQASKQANANPRQKK